MLSYILVRKKGYEFIFPIRCFTEREKEILLTMKRELPIYKKNSEFFITNKRFVKSPIYGYGLLEVKDKFVSLVIKDEDLIKACGGNPVFNELKDFHQNMASCVYQKEFPEFMENILFVDLLSLGVASKIGLTLYFSKYYS